jgi:starch synthase
MSKPAHRILFAASEAHPLIKTGGLADVAGSLPRALVNMGHDVRLVVPAYAAILDTDIKTTPVMEVAIDGHNVWLLKATLPGSRVKVWLVDCPEYFDRPGNPYLDGSGEPWPDNAQRFGLFNLVVSLLAKQALSMKWQPDLLHLNDWQTGLVPVLLRQDNNRPATVFTIHNLAYQGVFERADFEALGLDESLWHYQQLEYHGKFSFMKGGILYADRINTVSPGYAGEIKTPAFGCGLEGLLQERGEHLSGIINGIDTRDWNPGTDQYIARKYNRQHLADKQANKTALQHQLGLQVDKRCLLLGMVSRLAHQKGVDLLLDAMPSLMYHNVQVALLGSGDARYERALAAVAANHKGRVAVHIGYSEALAHAIEAGADVFMMPSRFEPCGLNQMYSQRYGTLPLVAPVGGLVDTVVDAAEDTLSGGTATGFVMPSVDAATLVTTVARALDLFHDKTSWQQMQLAAMAQDFSWQHSAVEYEALYARAMQACQQRRMSATG